MVGDKSTRCAAFHICCDLTSASEPLTFFIALPAVQPAKRHAEVLAELRNGLADLSISRPSSRLSWGIPVPGDPSHSIYVWVDALTNYLTVTGYPWKERGGGWEGTAWPADVHVVGKDIIR